MEPLSREITWRKINEAVKPGGRIIAMDSAIPHEKTMHVRFPRYLLKIDEQRFGSINSAHYENYPKFIDAGRIAARVRRRRMDIKVDRFHLGGDIGIIWVSA